MALTVAAPDGWPSDRRNTTRDLAAATARGERWSMLTAYDAFTARLFEDAGVRALLVGDTAGMVVYGRVDTVSVTIDELLPLLRAVVDATERALVVADMPFGSYEISPEHALRSAIRFMKEGGAHAIKLEGARNVLPTVAAIVRAGIPVCGHIGLTPQSLHSTGGYRVQGRGSDGVRLLEDAKALEAAGVFAIVLEAVPKELGETISAAVRVPTIGIGAGPGCDAQILVWQDMLGLTPGRVPRYVKRYADLRSVMTLAVQQYVDDVKNGSFPAADHSY
jgi:3-methyl-2-oxobutanoate hydroxymethyltransferase